MQKPEEFFAEWMAEHMDNPQMLEAFLAVENYDPAKHGTPAEFFAEWLEVYMERYQARCFVQYRGHVAEADAQEIINNRNEARRAAREARVRAAMRTRQEGDAEGTDNA